MEEADSELKSNLTNDQELENDCKKSNGKITEEVNFADNEKKRKKLFEDDKMGEAAKRFQCSEDSDNNGEGDKKKMKKKEKREKVDGEWVQKIITDGKEAGVESEHSDAKIMEKGGIMKKEKRNHRKKSRSQMQETVVEKLGTESSRIEGNNFLENDGNVQTTGDETSNSNIEVVYVEYSNKRKKRAKSKKHVNVGDCNEDEKEIAKSDKGKSKNPKKWDCNEDEKEIAKSDKGKVFPPCDAPKDAEKGLVQGKRFSEEEDKLVKEAVLTYIEEHRLGDEGIDKVLNCRSNSPKSKIVGRILGQPYPGGLPRAYIIELIFYLNEARNVIGPLKSMKK
ncbi:RNA polymerase I termination factor [Prunus yedoensis var. nudiflora]|uniref:RNA polymerase I termination factor n=1 Tax=Prunus yedoensis var. nudiflora TaxID=2094558 RepID=A0A314ZMZ9_PRUYE|nr:RNA polymerase I termination factor [Prunus yedoensis var. nudiflora]